MIIWYYKNQCRFGRPIANKINSKTLVSCGCRPMVQKKWIVGKERAADLIICAPIFTHSLLNYRILFIRSSILISFVPLCSIYMSLHFLFTHFNEDVSIFRLAVTQKTTPFPFFLIFQREKKEEWIWFVFRREWIFMRKKFQNMRIGSDLINQDQKRIGAYFDGSRQHW